MPYTTNKVVQLGFDEALARLREGLKAEGFGVITEIDMRETLKAKLGVEFRNYRIIGACNPGFAYKALQAEGRIGVLLPCNIVVQETASGGVELSAVRPTETMRVVGLEALSLLAREVEDRLAKVIAGVQEAG
jgi:uncharacterized protein (DUF302 family)